jgi:hypothetical protein
MKKKKSDLLVVDASVAQAAGYSARPISRCCRDTLDSILSICHRIMMSPAVSLEWRNHQSIYAFRWKATMVAKKKVVFINDPSFHVAVERAKELNDRERAALEKDKHLVELAVDGDGIIYTLDKTIIDIWGKCHKQVNTPKAIIWKNPADEDPKGMLR